MGENIGAGRGLVAAGAAISGFLALAFFSFWLWLVGVDLYSGVVWEWAGRHAGVAC